MDRIRYPLLRSCITSAAAKAVPLALAERARIDPLQITLMTGASLDSDVDKILTHAGMLARRMPFQSDPTLRAAINRGEVMFIAGRRRARRAIA